MFVIKKTNPELSPILTKLVNRYFKENSFSILKIVSGVCLAFRNEGARSSPVQYILISFLNMISKLVDGIINEWVEAHQEKNNLFSEEQFRFRSSRSIADVLSTITQTITGALDVKHTLRNIALGISRAFDNLWHKDLLHNLTSYGMTGSVSSIINSFLTVRSMKVCYQWPVLWSHRSQRSRPPGIISLTNPLFDFHN